MTKWKWRRRRRKEGKPEYERKEEEEDEDEDEEEDEEEETCEEACTNTDSMLGAVPQVCGYWENRLHHRWVRRGHTRDRVQKQGR